jgi:ankyrin repeat protein
VDGLRDVTNAIGQATERQTEHNQQQDIRYLNDKQRECHLAFKTCSYEDHKNINPERVPETCQWVFTHPQYQRWNQNPNSDLLWISADPGCGKSVLSRTLVDHELQNTSLHTVCYFFFKDNEEQNNLPTALCAVLHQLFASQPNLIQHAMGAWEKHDQKIQSETEELWRILLKAASDPQSQGLTCIFDALDECRESHQKRFISMLSGFYEMIHVNPRQGGSLKFLVTSRPYDDIQYQFKQIPASLPAIHLRGDEMNDLVRGEIDLVVRAKVGELAKRLGLNEMTRQKLEERLLGMEHRTYLWLYLAVESIRKIYAESFRLDEKSIDSLPSSVEDAYEKILAKVTPEQSNKAKTILQIVVGARRPLTTQEMAMALGVAISPRAQTAVNSGINPARLEEKIRRLCGLFVFFNNSRIYLIHQTAKEFLVGASIDGNSSWKHCFNPSDTEKLMARICTSYLLLDDLEKGGVHDEHNTQGFLAYSAEQWPDHFRSTTLLKDAELEGLVIPLYDVASTRFTLWFPLFWKTTPHYRGHVPEMHAIHLAAFNGHDSVMRQLLERERIYIDQQDTMEHNALYWASLQGHVQMVQLLLESGANVNIQGRDYGTALQAASASGYEKIVQILVDNSADVNAQRGHYGTALYAASTSGHEKIVQILADNSADVNAQRGHYGTALYAASESGYEKIVQILVDNSADVNAQGRMYGTALQAASASGHEKIVQILVDNSADVNAQGGMYGTALYAASESGHEKIVQIIVDNSADVNAQREYYGTALHAASAGGHEKIVQILVNNSRVCYK